jgi:hypothetical protein
MKYICNKCDEEKEEKYFYKSNLSTCKQCKAEQKEKNILINKNELYSKVEFLEYKINNIELLLKELIKKHNRGNVIINN